MLELDKSTWTRVKFGDAVRNINNYYAPDADGDLPYVAGPHIDPSSMVVASYGMTTDDNFPPTFKRKFQPGDVLLHSRGIEKIAVTDRVGVTGEKLFVLRAVDNEVLDQRFLPILLRSPLASNYLDNHFTGSVNRFLNWKPLAAWEFDLPPLDEQKRIADLLWATERHAQSLIEEAIAAKGARCELVAAHLAELPIKKRLGDLVTIRSGPSYPASNVHDSPVPGTQPVIGITNTRPDGTMDISRVSHVTGLPESTQTIDHSTLVLIRTNGNRSRIGNVYLPPKAAEGYAVSAFQFLLKVRDASLRDFIFTILNDRAMQSRMSDNASGTTGLGNLGSKWLSNQEIAWSESHSERDAVVSAGTSARKAEDSLYGERGKLLEMRSSLSSSIFGDL